MKDFLRQIQKNKIPIIIIILIALFGIAAVNLKNTLGIFDNIEAKIEIQKNGDALITEKVSYIPKGYYNFFLDIGGDSEIIEEVKVKRLYDNKKVEELSYIPKAKGLNEGEFTIHKDKYQTLLIIDATSVNLNIKTFLISYKVKNFVKTLEDKDFFDFKFFKNLTLINPKNIKIKISNLINLEDFSFEGNSKGILKKEKDSLVFKGNNFTDSDFLKIKGVFKKNSYNTSKIINKTITEYNTINFGNKLITISIYYFKMLKLYISVMFFNKYSIFLIVSLFFTYFLNWKNFKIYNIPKKKKIKNFYYREIPIKDWWNYWILFGSYATNINKKTNSEKNDDESALQILISTLFSKWVMEKRIKSEKLFIDDLGKEIGIIVFDKKNPPNDFKEERELWNYCIQAIGDGKNYLTPISLKLWFTNTSQHEAYSFLSMSKTLLVKSKEYLEREDLIKDYQGKLYAHDNLVEISKNLIGFYNYLRDFSIINEREEIKNSNLWKDYFIFSIIFGIDSVKEELHNKGLLPEIPDIEIWSNFIDINNEVMENFAEFLQKGK